MRLQGLDIAPLSWRLPEPLVIKSHCNKSCPAERLGDMSTMANVRVKAMEHKHKSDSVRCVLALVMPVCFEKKPVLALIDLKINEILLEESALSLGIVLPPSLVLGGLLDELELEFGVHFPVLLVLQYCFLHSEGFKWIIGL